MSFSPLPLGPQLVLVWSRVAEWSWPWPHWHFSGDQISAHLLWVIPEPKAGFSYIGKGLFGSFLTDCLALSSLEYSWSSWWHGARYLLPLSQGTWV